VGWTEDTWEHQVKIALKECTELAGWALICAGAVAAARKARRVETVGGTLTSDGAERENFRGRSSASAAPGS
jgi:hypothetical protein